MKLSAARGQQAQAQDRVSVLGTREGQLGSMRKGARLVEWLVTLPRVSRSPRAQRSSHNT